MINSGCFSVKGRSAVVTTVAMGRYGEKWREIEIEDATHFSTKSENKFFYGRRTLPPEEWKVLCWVKPIIVPKLRPSLSIVKN